MSAERTIELADAFQKKTLHTEGKSEEESRICSEYIERERNFKNEDVKVVERRKILNFLIANHPKGVRPCLLSMPCIHWKFEHSFYRCFWKHNPRFIGIEWTWGVMELGRPYMPKKKKASPVVFHEYQTSGNDSLKVVETDICKSVWAHAGSFLSLTLDDFDDDKRNKFAETYRNNTHVWLDFTSQLCRETKDALAGLGSFLNISADKVPVAVTLMAARDDHRSNESRVATIYSVLNQRGHRYFDLKEWWIYQHHDIPMLTVCGLMTKGSAVPSPEEMMRLHADELGLKEKETDVIMDDLSQEVQVMENVPLEAIPKVRSDGSLADLAAIYALNDEDILREYSEVKGVMRMLLQRELGMRKRLKRQIAHGIREERELSNIKNSLRAVLTEEQLQQVWQKTKELRDAEGQVPA